LVEETKSRIQQFSCLTGGQDSAILYLLYTSYADDSGAYHGLETFMALQCEILQTTTPLPLLLVSKPEALQAVLKAFVASATKPLKGSPMPNALRHLLPFCTTSPPLDEVTVAVLADLFPCIRDYARFMQERDVMVLVDALASNGVGRETIDGVVRFWSEQTVAQA
jgi:hypothetical protein